MKEDQWLSYRRLDRKFHEVPISTRGKKRMFEVLLWHLGEAFHEHQEEEGERCDQMKLAAG